MKPAVINTIPNKATLDLYQPQYKPPPVKARFFEMGAEEPEIDILKVDLGKTSGFEGCLVCDSGESHSLTDNLQALCRYQKLTRPIPLYVATKCTGRRSYVKGIGSLVFKGEGGSTTIIHGVFYSPNASCTRISLAALIQAGAILSSESNDILLCNASHIPIMSNDRRESGNPQEARTSPITIMKGRITETQCKMQSNVQESTCNIIASLHCLFGHIGLKRLKKIVQQCFGDTAATEIP
ncbi:hypothetical protein O181_124892 [Austropuccinia psidii MF-1]|uniref:Retrovirus-related Pol polyprotein from transposon TNT 1-94-like beta-barrel domain-containing protein n=1 Tax=Austropuccinia psidii MF-1 TaxID=1389203 RepID=A0A9Q3KQG3_9BASI|nr:hypothetical protein [Austropuccinia psidii MF-1]